MERRPPSRVRQAMRRPLYALRLLYATVRALDVCPMAQPPSPWPNNGAMRHYLCPGCLHVVRSDRNTPFDWCAKCGQPLDAVSLLTKDVPLAEHPSVRALERRARFAKRRVREPSVASVS